LFIAWVVTLFYLRAYSTALQDGTFSFTYIVKTYMSHFAY